MYVLFLHSKQIRYVDLVLFPLRCVISPWLPTDYVHTSEILAYPTERSGLDGNRRGAMGNQQAAGVGLAKGTGLLGWHRKWVVLHRFVSFSMVLCHFVLYSCELNQFLPENIGLNGFYRSYRQRRYPTPWESNDSSGFLLVVPVNSHQMA